jgi:Ni/Fe-hydrogenase subunit HybB-like protein
MGLTIIFSVILISSIIAIISLRKSDSYWSDAFEPAAWIGAIVGGIAVVIISIVLINEENEFAYNKEQYYNLQKQVETLSKDNIVTGENLRNQVLEMNNMISKHKIYSKSLWVGVFYSEEIGSLEPLEWGIKE